MGNACSARVKVEKEERLPSKWEGKSLGIKICWVRVCPCHGERRRGCRRGSRDDSTGTLPDEVGDMRRECRLLKEIKHQGILKYIDHVEEMNDLFENGNSPALQALSSTSRVKSNTLRTMRELCVRSVFYDTSIYS